MNAASSSHVDTDLFVIGGGSGGVRAARIAASHGARVMLAEEYRMGGTCVIRGCVPKKLLVYAGRFADAFRDATGFGWEVGETRFDWASLIAAKDREIARLEMAYTTTLRHAGVEIVPSRATLTGPDTVRIEATGREIRARHTLIATGASPVREPAIPGIEHAITSNEAFHLERLPERILVVGAGYIALEFAGLFRALGSAVTLAYRADLPLRGFDEELRQGLADAYSGRGITLKPGMLPTRIVPDGTGYAVSLSDGGTLLVDQVMVATGRRPNTQGLGLEAAGVILDAAGAIAVDAFSATNVPTIHAVGDVTNRANLTPVAIREGHAFADTVFGGKPSAVDHRLIPTAVFSTPEMGTIGLGEADARAAGHRVTIFRARFRPMLATLSGREERTLMKLVVDADSDRVLGLHMLGPDAGEIVQMAAIAITMGATKADFDRTMALHPSAGEEFVTMRTPAS